MGLVVQTRSSKMASQQQVLIGIPRVTKSKSYIVSLTECVPANPEIMHCGILLDLPYRDMTCAVYWYLCLSQYERSPIDFIIIIHSIIFIIIIYY